MNLVHYSNGQDFAWRLSRELPQGRNAARVNGLWRVCEVPLIFHKGQQKPRRGREMTINVRTYGQDA
ncbi:hypothetical protein GCM10009621_09840 [Corynebacterium felinum]